MLFRPADIDGAYLIVPEPHADERGYFARLFCADEFESRGLLTEFPQTSVSHNRLRGTLRGLHFQEAPATETKLIRCTRGSVHDVIVDLRADSPTYGKHFAVALSADNPTSLYVPKGCAHGFQTLADDTDLEYQLSERYAPGAARGVRYDDPALGIEWPLPVSVIAPKDLAWPSLPRPASLTPGRS